MITSGAPIYPPDTIKKYKDIKLINYTQKQCSLLKIKKILDLPTHDYAIKIMKKFFLYI